MSEPNTEQRVFAYRIAEDGGWHNGDELAGIIAERDAALMRKLAGHVRACADAEDVDELADSLEQGGMP